FRMMPVGQAVLGGKEVLRKANDAFLQLCGLARGQMHEQTLESLFGAPARHRFASVYAASGASARLAYDDDLRRPDGSTVPVRLEAVCLTAEAAGPVWGVALHDLTERRNLESMSIRSAQLEAENHRVSEANEAKNLFLANMSHELRTPMNAILGFSQLLVAGEVGPLSEMQAEFVSDIDSSGRHLLRLINDILDLSKVEAGKLELYPEDVDLRALTEDSVQLAIGMLAAGRVRVVTDIAESLGPARLDPSRFKQVLLNYLTNAIKFSPPGGRIHIALEPEGASRFRVSVRDEGPGIGAEDLPRLFGVFEQLDAGRAKRHGGTGLGLALTKKLVESQGGKVGVHCEKGHGCGFHAILPLRAREGTELP
ncbi:MAG: PAS domain-containing hybrid sensor histidine kinase/response regulator, partial [Proteobacteria bacterium]